MSIMRTIALFNDSFPPLIDGVSNAVLNYAQQIKAHYGEPVVVTPEYPYADDSQYDFPILRYHSIDITKKLNVVAGIPYAPKQAKQLIEGNADLLHCHCPAASIVLARTLRDKINAPLVMTYHSKYDIDIRNVVRTKVVQDNVIGAMMESINACDEVWAVSHGAGENLKSLGYTGDYVVMENGVDLPHERVNDAFIREVTGHYDIPEGIPVFLFAGRMMWYKGIRIIIDALTGLMASGMDFRMVFVGKGTDFGEIQQYVRDTGLEPKVIYAGAVYDRNQIRAWYCRADVLLFPSTFDTNGLVVREAAACSLPAVLIEGSCAAEGVTDGRNGYLIAENAVALAVKLDRICKDMDAVHRVGENAGNEIYISWEDSIRKATERYEVVIDNYKSGRYPQRKKLTDEFFKSVGELMSFDLLEHISF